MTTRVPTLRRVLLVLIAGVAVAGCGGSTPAVSTRPASSPAAEIPLPDFNSRLGSNRLAAEAAAQLGRVLYGQGQYWEVYVRTTPPTLPGKYDPADPSASKSSATGVTQTDVIIATESGAAIKSFGAGGDAHERSVLGALDAVLRASFPNMTIDTIKVFYGESFQHGAAVFNQGKLTQYSVRKLG